MTNIQYLRPETLSEALEALSSGSGGARPLLGGTDLIVRIRRGYEQPAAVVDLKKVQDISRSINYDADSVAVGARAVLADAVHAEQIRRCFPALAEASAAVGSVQIRNRATLVGNICNSSPAADTVPPMIVYGASVDIAGSGGMRRIALRDFITGPGTNQCGRDELVVSIRLPLPTMPFGAAFGRLTRRKGADLATVNIACGIHADGSTEFAFGAVGPKPVVVRDTSGVLADDELADDDSDEILRSLAGEAVPISDVRAGREYRQAMLLTMARRVLSRARRHRAESAAQGAK